MYIFSALLLHVNYASAYFVRCNELNKNLQVTDTRGHTLYKRENFPETRGKFAFTADEYDIFEMCITIHAPERKFKISHVTFE